MERYYLPQKLYNNEKYKVACIFPERYGLGICNLGHQIIFNIINNDPEFYADRIYYNGSKESFSVINGWDISEFDYIFVSFSFETNILNFAHMMQVWKIPLYASERTDSKYPLMIAGGMCASYNPETIADFFDAIVIGEGENCILHILDILRSDNSKENFLEKLFDVRGIYIPSYYNPIYLNKCCDNNYDISLPRQTLPVNIEKNTAHTIVSSDESSYSSHCFTIEVRRGCTQNCRFCVIGNNLKPARQISVTKFTELVDLALSHGTKYIKLFYEGVQPEIISNYINIASEKGASVRVGSQRLETTSCDLIDAIANSNQRKITFAPETSSRLRRVLGKSSLSDNELLSKIEYALHKGIIDVGLYFIVGLPYETDEDLLQISQLINRVFDIIKRSNTHGNLVVGINPLYPKPSTSLQLSDFLGQDEAKKRFKYILNHIKDQNAIDLNQNYVDETIMSSKGNYELYKEIQSRIIFETSIYSSLCFFQTILSRGDRRLSRVIEMVCGNSNSIKEWQSALNENFLNEEMFYTISNSSSLPWNIVDRNIGKDYLLTEYQNALKLNEVEKCILDCKQCNVQCLTL